jgi:hypothetical protein
LRFALPRGLGQKVSDEFTVPLCRAHHRELHRAGKERDWSSRNGTRAKPVDDDAPDRRAWVMQIQIDLGFEFAEQRFGSGLLFSLCGMPDDVTFVTL